MTEHIAAVAAVTSVHVSWRPIDWRRREVDGRSVHSNHRQLIEIDMNCVLVWRTNGEPGTRSVADENEAQWLLLRLWRCDAIDDCMASLLASRWTGGRPHPGSSITQLTASQRQRRNCAAEYLSSAPLIYDRSVNRLSLMQRSVLLFHPVGSWTIGKGRTVSGHLGAERWECSARRRGRMCRNETGLSYCSWPHRSMLPRWWC